MDIDGPVTIANIRYKPQTSCLVSYRSGLENRRSPHGWIHAKAFRSDDWGNRKANIARNHPDRSTVQLFDELAVAVFSFPEDSELPAIARLFRDPNEFLKQVIDDPIGTVSKVSVLAYKPNRRLTAKIETDLERSVVVKLYERQHSKTINRKLRSLSRSGIPIPNRLGHSHRHRALCFQWIEGHVPDLARSDDRQIEWLVTRLSERIDSFQDFPIKRRKLEKSNPTESIASIAQDMSNMFPPIAAVVNEAAERIISLLQEYQQPKSSSQQQIVHGDFHPNQVLVHDDQVTVCDFDRCQLGDPVSDWGNFLAHVQYDTFCGKYPAGTCQRIAGPVTRLSLFSDQAQRNKLELFQLVSLLQLVTSPFRSGLENWKDMTESLVTKINQRSRQLASTSGQNAKNSSLEQSILNDDSFSFLHDCLSVAGAGDVFSSEEFQPRNSLVDASVVEVIARRHKPGRRCLIEFRLESENGTIAIVGKASAKKLKRQAMQHQQSLHDEYGFGTGSADAISVPRTRGSVKKWKMWFQDWIDARTCRQICEDENTSGVPVRISAAIWKLHRCQYDPGREHLIFDEMAILTDRLRKYQKQVPENESRIEKIILHCNDLCADLESAESVLLHRDFYHDQVLLSEDRIWLVDLDLIAKGHPGIDVGNFLAHLAELGLRQHGNPDHYRQFEDQLSTEYHRLNPNCSSPSIQICKTLSLARHIFISCQFTDRCQMTEAIIKLVEHRLQACASHRANSFP